MKRIIIFLFIIAALICAGVWWYSSTNTNNKPQAKNDTPNYQAERSNVDTNIKTKNNDNTNITDYNVNNEITIPKKETQIATFSTKIHNKDEERQNNIGITCKTLSTKEVQPGEIFSFCDTVGKATHAKGYEEADIYVDGKKEQGLGGGNCQVSTTLYNAVLQVPELEVVERHQHSGNVPYVQKGKDAAVSYGAYDFKFKNNTNNVIKIVMENSPENVTAKLLKIE